MATAPRCPFEAPLPGAGECLMKPPWEPIHQLSLKQLTLKTVFLLAVTSARRMSELQVLSLEGRCYRYITPDILLVCTNVEFLPKCKTEFHRAQEIQLEAFYPRPSMHRESLLVCVPLELCRHMSTPQRIYGNRNSSLSLTRWGS